MNHIHLGSFVHIRMVDHYKTWAAVSPSDNVNFAGTIDSVANISRSWPREKFELNFNAINSMDLGYPPKATKSVSKQSSQSHPKIEPILPPCKEFVSAWSVPTVTM